MPESTNRERQVIFNLQRYLRQLSFDSPEIPTVPLDGIFDTATERSLRAYQNMIGLESTGRADAKTWERLYADYLASVERNRRPLGFDIFPNRTPNDAVYPDEQHFLVEVIQYILNELRQIYDDIPQNNQSGKYDSITRQGVLAFQRRHFLPENDRVDLTTWNALTDAYSRLGKRDES